jgi:acyl carrier protein
MDEALAEYLSRRERVIGEVKHVLVTALKVKRAPDAIDLDVMLFGSGLGLDSVDALELVIALEARYGLVVEETRFRTSLRTVNSLVDLILEAQKEGRARVAVGTEVAR